jgi:serine/threonine protein kinase
MGEVYRARDTRVGREVAVKILPAEFATDPQRRRRFEQEARLAASLNHPNIVGLYDVGPDLNPPYIVSELVAGVSLRTLMGRGTMPLRKVLDLSAQMAEGLAAAHALGVVHRDMKPENVMVTPEGRVKILDFGLARVQEVRGAGVTRTGVSRAGTQSVTVDMETPMGTSPGVVVGTVSYMSPEQASGRSMDYRSDQFSLGLILYELLSRQRAFERPTSAQTMAAIIEDEAPMLPASVPTQVRWLVDRCLAKEPVHRYASTLDLARELRQLQEHVGELTPPTGESAAVVRKRSVPRLRVLVAAATLALMSIAIGRITVNEPRVDLAAYELTPFATQLMTSYAQSWSPDGKSVAFLGKEEGSGVQLYVQRFDSPAPIRITQPPLFLYDHTPAWSPDSRTLYCTASMDDVASVYRVPVSGGDPVLVQRGAYWWTLSPDAKTLLALGQGGAGKGLTLQYASPPDATPRVYAPDPFEGMGRLSALEGSFAPGGKDVLLAAYDREGAMYWLVPWPPGKARRVLEGLGESAGFSWMPDSRHMVLAVQPRSDPTQPVRLMMADVSANRYWPLMVSNSQAGYPAVSPDGQRIMFTSVLGHRDIVELPLAGGPARTVLGSSREEAMPAVSRDDREMVYIGNPRGAEEVWSRDAEDGTLRRLLAPADIPADSGRRALFLKNPVLSPDRRRLAVTANIERMGPRLFTAFTAGGSPVRAIMRDAGDEIGGSWSPDGDRIAYLAARESGFNLAVARIGSTEPPTYLADSLYSVLPEWSPTGEWIAVLSSPLDRTVLISPDGSARRAVGNKGGGGLCAWSPDGRTLYVVNFTGPAEGRVTAIDARTGAERVVRDLAGLSATDFMPSGIRMSVSGDSRSLVCGVKRLRSEIWMLDGVRVPRPWYARLLPW